MEGLHVGNLGSKRTGTAGPLKAWLARRIAGLFTRGATVSFRYRSPAGALTVGSSVEADFVLTMAEPDVLWQVLRNPDPGLGDAYMDGAWTLDTGHLGALLTVLARNRQRLLEGPAGSLARTILGTVVPDYPHDPESSREQIGRHYDIGDDLYSLFLDEGLNYSCAFFDRPQASLREAQLNKVRTTISRLNVEPGMRVLDIGCGWGEVCRTIAARTGASRVTGITLAQNQQRTAEERSFEMENPPSFLLEDYREHAARHAREYDRIVSIGMFEHVGAEHHDTYFSAIERQLAPGGRALVHSILRPGTGRAADFSSPWLNRYIFPGGSIPNLDQVLSAARKSGLEAMEVFLHEPFHYAETLRRWRANFVENAHRLDPERYDDRFRRMWLFYLAMCEAMFDACGYHVAQVVLRRQ
jgi:cyclopropane-fatty-acyl-phospholipid synthase